ncbi:hypothetical protein [Pseudocitrobacter vendiensis]|uniref:DNA polymerase IV n=1 Tax=Pseudocitrobacter vendiensis TaxID=2488306 RepID=A0ABN8T6D3_9ENTR|nr:hypothetical protein [Pseudocitrobacter vendiensis]CAH6635745.1 hypothetical protein FBBNIHIM_02800 [Pseudocitrobacter vendiensis]
MKTMLTALLKRLQQIWLGTDEHSAERVIESVLPVASLYGVDVANIEPEWFRDQAR